MNHFLKIFLDEPEKAEQVLLYTLQALVIGWLLSLLFYPNLRVMNAEYQADFFEFTFLKSFSPIAVATYIILFVATWIIWFGLAETITRPFFILVGFILGWIFYFLFYPIRVLLTGITAILVLIRLKKNIYKFWYKEPIEKGVLSPQFEYHKSIRHEMSFFKLIDDLTEDAGGSMFLLAIMQHEKADFVRSRIFQYFFIVLAVCVAYFMRIGFSNFELIEYIMLYLLIAFGATLAMIDNAYSVFRFQDLTWVEAELKANIYRVIVKDAIFGTYLHWNYDMVKKFGQTLVLKLKSKALIEQGYKEELSILLLFEGFSFTRILNSQFFERRENKFVVFISYDLPDLATLNFLVDQKVIFVNAKSEKEIRDAILKLEPIIKGRENL